MPVINYYLLQEDGSYLLQEDDSKIIISSQNLTASCYSVTLTYIGPATGHSYGVSGCCDSTYDTGILSTGESVNNIILADPNQLLPYFVPSNIVAYECPTPTPTPTPTSTPASTPTPTPTPTLTPIPPDVPPSTAVVPYNLGLTSETTIYVNEVKCRVLENDFNYSQNPTVFKYTTFVTGALALPFYAPQDSQAQVGIVVDGTIADNLTGSAFNPYATTIGLFSPANELLVVGKFATPYQIPENTDITFIVRWDS